MTIFEEMLQLFMNDSFFDSYTFRKRDSSFIQKCDGGYRQILLSHLQDICYFRVSPVFIVRFDFVHKWFEKYSSRPLRSQRDDATVVATPIDYGLGGAYGREYLIDLKNNHIIDELNKIKQITKICADKFFSTYITPLDVFNHDILPILEGKKELPTSGAFWLFQNLTICKVVAPESYAQLKAILLEHAKWIVTSSEKHPMPDLNMVFYYDRLDEILSFMESLSFEELKKIRVKDRVCDDPLIEQRICELGQQLVERYAKR